MRWMVALGVATSLAAAYFTLRSFGVLGEQDRGLLSVAIPFAALAVVRLMGAVRKRRQARLG